MADSANMAKLAFYQQALGSVSAVEKSQLEIEFLERLIAAGITIASDGTLTLPGGLTISAALNLTNTGLKVYDTGGDHLLTIAPGSDLSTDRTLTITTGDAARTVTFSGNPTLGDWFDQSVKAAATPTFAGLALGANTVTGAVTLAGLANTGLRVLDTNASHYLQITPGSDLTDNRVLTITTGDAARTVTFSGNPTLGDWFDQSVKVAASPTFAGITATGNIDFAGFDLTASTGVAVFASTAGSAWTFNSTDASGGRMLWQRSGVLKGTIGPGTAGASADQFGITAEAALYLHGDTAGTNGRVTLNGAAMNPVTTNVISIGASGALWTAVYATNTTIQTSDIRFKDDFSEVPGLDFVLALDPIGFRRIDTNKDDQRARHFGFSAQQVHEELAKRGIEDSWLVRKPGTDAEKWGMAEGELIASVVKSIKELHARMEQRQAQ